ncbi:hypothetical protein ABXV18_27135 [Vibrio owensii]|uniref:hypothetical protein n=1 Tax=Vibrio owensii TaxID=696485 RepID=UPI003396B236
MRFIVEQNIPASVGVKMALNDPKMFDVVDPQYVVDWSGVFMYGGTITGENIFYLYAVMLAASQQCDFGTGGQSGALVVMDEVKRINPTVH